MARKKRSEQELRAASDHLFYEIWMFQSLARDMASRSFTENVVNNALLESFTIHTRILLDFLFAAKPQLDDVIAEDFFEDPATWHNVRPPKSEILETVHKRVGKEIAHLTYASSCPRNG